MNDFSADSAPGDELRVAARDIGLELTVPQSRLLAAYCRLLWSWNEKINLTRHTDLAKFVRRDLLDTWAFARAIQADEIVLDVGTGGGVPGIPLAVLRPDVRVYLCETVAKKARVVHDIVTQLGLPIPVLHGRVEEFLSEGRWEFHSLLFRAVAPLSKILRWVRPHWERFDRLLILKGPRWVEERGEARHFGYLQGLALRVMDRYEIPDTAAESLLLQITRKDRCGEGKTCRLSRRQSPETATATLIPPRTEPSPDAGRRPGAGRQSRRSGKPPRTRPPKH
ncbi:MAG: 16S rRNA (guanine(527)-N(7))-methyltransferase RsmG [Thermogutta sp.]|nr:16S rRNA (guanine(527)-N(7))-methyltransferase RsmG [Thermogutta sp.]